MKILLCPDKFKGSISAVDVCNALQLGIKSVDDSIEIVNHPMADGGDGSIGILKNYIDLQSIHITTVDPLGKDIDAIYYRNDSTAFIELASASGLALLQEEEKNPLYTSTYGTGIMIKHAIDNGVKTIHLFIGGSATNDAGIGIAHALGFRFTDQNHNAIQPIGANLSDIQHIVDPAKTGLHKVAINILCDVVNPMHGPQGAAYTYAGQKGANSHTIEQLDQGLKSYSDILKQKNNRDDSSLPGMGAAGAVGASLVGLLGAQLMNGFDMIARHTGLIQKIKSADLVITGEGKVDATSYQGKVVGNVLSICQAESKPCYLVGGLIDLDDDQSSKLPYYKSIISLAKNISESMHHPQKYLYAIGIDIAKTVIKSNPTEKNDMQIFTSIKESLTRKGYSFERMDFNRPWGGFFVLNQSHKKQFIAEYFDKELSDRIDTHKKLSPKILIVAPHQRLSWQYHHRRSEMWQIVHGPVGVVRSDTDLENEVIRYESGDRIELSCGERHRLVGLDDISVVAEIWIHEDPNHPSDEDDIVRLQDDFGR